MREYNLMNQMRMVEELVEVMFTFYIYTLYTSLKFWKCPYYKADYVASFIKFFPTFLMTKGENEMLLKIKF